MRIPARCSPTTSRGTTVAAIIQRGGDAAFAVSPAPAVRSARYRRGRLADGRPRRARLQRSTRPPRRLRINSNRDSWVLLDPAWVDEATRSHIDIRLENPDWQQGTGSSSDGPARVSRRRGLGQVLHRAPDRCLLATGGHAAVLDAAWKHLPALGAAGIPERRPSSRSASPRRRAAPPGSAFAGPI